MADVHRTNAELVESAMKRIMAEDTLFAFLDAEATILAQWAYGRLGVAMAAARNGDEAIQLVCDEESFIKRALLAIEHASDDLVGCDRRMVIAAMTALLSELKNGGWNGRYGQI